MSAGAGHKIPDHLLLEKHWLDFARYRRPAKSLFFSDKMLFTGEPVQPAEFSGLAGTCTDWDEIARKSYQVWSNRLTSRYLRK